jgi:surfactin family lipopeptide synthetase A
MSKDSSKGRGFSEQKLALLASLLEKEGVQQAPRLKRIPRDGELPISSAQMRLWLFDQLEPGSAAYNVAIRHDFNGHFDLVAFERSLSEIVRRHEVLRTCFLRVDGRPVQKIVPPELFRIPVTDLQSISEVAREGEVASLASADAQQPFDLEKTPLIRAQLLKLAPDKHVLLLNFHHIAFDWWSYGVIEKELAVLYDAFLRGEEASPLPELPLQYVDFAAWQRHWLQGEILQEQLDYWKKKLSGTLPVLELPTDRPRPAIQTYNGSLFTSVLSKQLTEALKILNQREGATMFATLLGAFSVLLQRYTGQDDILVGAPTAGRNRAEIEGLLGFFVNTLVMRTDLSGDPTFRQLLRRLKETTVGAYAHQDLPFEKLVEVLNPERDASHSPMFQVMLSMLDTPKQPVSLPNLQHQRNFVDSGTSKFDLTLNVIEEQGLSFICEYNTDLFNRDRIERLLGHLQVLLEGIVADPDRHLSELQLLTAEERHRLLIEWNDTRVAHRNNLLHELFEAQVERTPGAVAVECDDARLTYRELNQQANQLARHLQSLGVGPDVVVGLCVERSLEMVVGLMGILKAGGAYVPLDPSFPEARLAYMIADSGMKVLVTHRQLDRSLTVRPPSIVYLDADWGAISGQDTTKAKLPSPRPENLAYVLYTSGSTGKPKGVAIPHAAVVNFLRSMQRQPGFTANDKLLAVTTLSFDIAGLEIYLPLVSGGTTVIASREDVYDPARLIKRIHESQCTVMQATPATWRALIDAGWEGSKNLKVLCGGEALPGDLVQALLPRCAQLWNMYGPTETTIWSTIHRVTSAGGPVPIGRPIANTQVFVLDKHRQLVPAGIVGELYIGGLGLAQGYFARPELTAERFVENPFDPDARLYRTGDQARWLPEGTLECLGRADNQVKIRGFRIELGEVEAALARYSAVGQCVVVAREDSHGDKILAAYLEPQPGQSAPAVSDLRTHLSNELPAYMVPSAFVVMQKLPLTPNGKIDRNALPTPNQDRIEVSGEVVPPRDPIEQMLVQIWSRILRVRSLGIRDNFFDLGGHSLLAVRIIAEIETLVKRRLPLATFLQAPTISHLAEVLRKEDWKPSWSSLTPIRPGGSKPPLFLLHSHGGNVLEYYPLAKYLGADQPVYALQALGLDGHIIKDQSFEDMVEAYLTELRSLQPGGPYFLGGYCLGGLLALEAARQLSEAGEEVALVILIQSINPSHARFRPDLTVFHRRWYQTTKRVDLELEHLRNRGANHILERCRRAWDIALARTAITIDNWTSNGHNARKQRSMAYTLEVLAIEHDKARVRYVPRSYNGPVVLFRAKKQLSGLVTDLALGWKEVLCGSLEIFEVPGHQETMLSEPNVAFLAERLTTQLLAAQRSRLPSQLVVDAASSIRNVPRTDRGAEQIETIATVSDIERSSS